MGFMGKNTSVNGRISGKPCLITRGYPKRRSFHMFAENDQPANALVPF